MIYSLMADSAALSESWKAGTYTSQDGTAATVQLNARAIGQCQAIEDVIETIRGITEINDDEEDIR